MSCTSSRNGGDEAAGKAASLCYTYIYMWYPPLPELSTNFGGRKRVGLHYAPDPLACTSQH